MTTTTEPTPPTTHETMILAACRAIAREGGYTGKDLDAGTDGIVPFLHSLRGYVKADLACHQGAHAQVELFIALLRPVLAAQMSDTNGAVMVDASWIQKARDLCRPQNQAGRSLMVTAGHYKEAYQQAMANQIEAVANGLALTDWFQELGIKAPADPEAEAAWTAKMTARTQTHYDRIAAQVERVMLSAPSGGLPVKVEPVAL